MARRSTPFRAAWTSSRSGRSSVTPDPAKATTYAIERSNLTARQWNARLRRRTLAFSKKLSRHCAAVALHYVHANLCHIPRNMRVTPAMAANVIDHVWTLEDLLVAALSEPAGEVPKAKPLTIPRPEGTARELPGGRGWLRVLDGGNGVAQSPAPAPEPPGAGAVALPAPSVQAAPAAPAQTSTPAVDACGQLDLLSWKPKTRKPVQLRLFGDIAD